MRISKIVPVLALSALTTGCISDEQIISPPDTTPVERKEIVFGVDGLPQPQNNETRAAMDGWENTPVSVGYKFAVSQTEFDKSMTVTVEDAGPLAT
jgi:hypothetical protein